MRLNNINKNVNVLFLESIEHEGILIFTFNFDKYL